MVLYDLFGPYATIIGQALTIIAIATLLIQLGRYVVSKRGEQSGPRIYFILLTAVIIASNGFAMLRSLDEFQESQKIELLNVKLNNQTLTNQYLIKEVLKQGDVILNQTKHSVNGRGFIPVS